MSLRLAFVLFLSVAGSGAWAADEIREGTVPTVPRMQAAPSFTGAAKGAPAQNSIEQQMGSLQQQIRTLQAQVAALQAAVQVTPTGVTLQGPTVRIAGGAVNIEAQRGVALTGGTNVAVKTGSLVFDIATGVSLRSVGPVDLRGSTIKLNGVTTIQGN